MPPCSMIFRIHWLTPRSSTVSEHSSGSASSTLSSAFRQLSITARWPSAFSRKGNSGGSSAPPVVPKRVFPSSFRKTLTGQMPTGFPPRYSTMDMSRFSLYAPQK